MRALAAYGPEALSHPISDVMAAEVRTVAMDDDLTDVAASMTELRVRHMPVLVDGQLAAIVSIGDIVKSHIDDLQSETEYLTNYVHGRPVPT